EHGAVRFWRIGERQLASYRGAQRAALERRAEPGVNLAVLVRGRRPQRRPQNRQLLAHRLARVDLDAAAVADDDDASLRGEQREVAIEVAVREHLEDDVDAPPAGGVDDLRRVALLAMVEALHRAGLPRHLRAGLAARGPEDAKPERPRELRCRDADRAAGAMHQHGLAGPHAGPEEERAVRRRRRDAERRALRE